MCRTAAAEYFQTYITAQCHTALEVDVKTEELVARAIAEDFSGKTVVAIAHRLATLQRAQRVLVLEKGTVAAPETTHKHSDTS